VQPAVFERKKEKYMRSLKNWDMEQPHSHARQNVSHLLSSNVRASFKAEEKLQALDNVRPEQVDSLVQELWRECYLQALCSGNLTQEQSKKAFQSVVGTLAFSPLPLAHIPAYRRLQLPAGVEHQLACTHPNPAEKNSAVCKHYDLGVYSLRQHALLKLCADLAKQPIFNQLRTVEQLGYLVWSFSLYASASQTLAFQVVVQSSSHACSHLDTRMELCLQDVADMLQSMEADKFEQHRSALVAKTLKRADNMREVSHFCWNEIFTRQFRFQHKHQMAQQLQALTQQDVASFWLAHISRSASCGPVTTHRKLKSFCHSQNHLQLDAGGKEEEKQERNKEFEQVAVQVIDDVHQFRQNLSLYPSANINHPSA